jgi:hypothetical protein
MRIRTALGGATLALALTFGSSVRAAPVSIYCELAQAAAARVEQLRGSKVRSDKLAFRAFKKVVKLAGKRASTSLKELKIDQRLAKFRAKRFTRATPGKGGADLVVLDGEALDEWLLVDFAAINACSAELLALKMRLELAPDSPTKSKAEQLAVPLALAVFALQSTGAFPDDFGFAEYAGAIEETLNLKRRYSRLVERATRGGTDGDPVCTGEEQGRGEAAFADRPTIQFQRGGGRIEFESGPSPANSRTLLAALSSADGQDVSILAFLSTPNRTGKVTLSQGEFEITLQLNDDDGVRNHVARVEASEIVMNVRRSEACNGTRLFEFEFEGVPITVYHSSSPFVPLDSDTLDLIVLVEARDGN